MSPLPGTLLPLHVKSMVKSNNRVHLRAVRVHSGRGLLKPMRRWGRGTRCATCELLTHRSSRTPRVLTLVKQGHACGGFFSISKSPLEGVGGEASLATEHCRWRPRRSHMCCVSAAAQAGRPRYKTSAIRVGVILHTLSSLFRLIFRSIYIQNIYIM